MMNTKTYSSKTEQVRISANLAELIKEIAEANNLTFADASRELDRALNENSINVIVLKTKKRGL